MRKSVQTQGVFILAALLILAGQAAATLEMPYEVQWTRQLGTRDNDVAYGVSTDGLGGVYVAGQTLGSLAGSNAGNIDAFLAKYDSAGNTLWIRQFGTNGEDSAAGVSADGLGNVFVTGRTVASSGAGSVAFLSKYDVEGNLQWTNQNSQYKGQYVSSDGLGNAYVSGEGGGKVFLSKFNSVGILLWTRQFGADGHESNRGLSADSMGNVFIAGYTDRSFGGPSAGGSDAFVIKCDSDGSHLWTTQLGADGAEDVSGVSADGLGNVCISSSTYGSLGAPNEGKADAFVSKLGSQGQLLWTGQLGTRDHDWARDVAVDVSGNVYLLGETPDALGEPHLGSYDLFVSKYDVEGTFLWTRQFGTTKRDAGYGLSVDLSGDVYVSGFTEGSLGADNAGYSDAFLAKLVVPEPATLLLLGLGAFVLCKRRDG
jgi:hypothetical protein